MLAKLLIRQRSCGDRFVHHGFRLARRTGRSSALAAGQHGLWWAVCAGTHGTGRALPVRYHLCLVRDLFQPVVYRMAVQALGLAAGLTVR